MTLEPILSGTAATLALRLRQRIVLVVEVTACVVPSAAVLGRPPEAITLARGLWNPRALIAFAATGLG